MQGSGEDSRRNAEIAAEEQLMLADEGAPLPWLESDDDYEVPGFNWRIVVYTVAGLLLVVILLGGSWYLLHRHAEREVVADGSTILAPAQPYKTRPANPGGAIMPGTGDISYAVGEGETVVSKVAEKDVPSPAPSAGAAPANASANAQSDQAAAAKPEKLKGVGVQVGAYTTRSSAQSGWQKLQVIYPPLKGVHHRIVVGTVDGGTIYRLQAVTGNVSSARTLCRSIKSLGGDCQIRD